jgi:hypothetical protein
MKMYLLIIGLAILAAPTNKAHAYSSAAGPDPKNATDNLGQEIETKLIVKSGTAGSSDAISAGDVLGYDQTAQDGYTVTKSISQNQQGLKTLACVALESIATGDTQYHRCAVRGFVKVPYDGSTTAALEAGRPACVTSKGLVRGCVLGGSNNIEATANTGIIPLKSASDADTTIPIGFLPVMLQLR